MADIGETTNIASQHPEIVKRLQSLRRARQGAPGEPASHRGNGATGKLAVTRTTWLAQQEGVQTENELNSQVTFGSSGYGQSICAHRSGRYAALVVADKIRFASR